MKAIYSRLAAMTMCLAAISAGGRTVSSDVAFYEDFSNLGAHGDPLPEGWVTYGLGEVPLPAWQSVFGNDGEAPYYRLMSITGTWGAFSNSSFIEDVESDEWLVTPKIRIDSDEEILMLTAGAYGKAGIAALNEFSVFVSETGNRKEDFTKAPVAQSFIYGKTSAVNTKRIAIPLIGYGGKDVYLAIVNRSKDSALFGVTEISVAPCYISITDNTPQVLPAESETQVEMSVQINTPSEIDGITVSLSTSIGIESKVEINRTVNIAGKTFGVVFPETIKVPEGGITYTVTVDPGIEGVEPTVVEGAINTPTRKYTPVAVVEEMTGSWCGWCPRGTAYLDYFKDKYNNDEGHVIGIAVHYNDKMEIEGTEYLRTLQQRAGTTSFPTAYFQRTVYNDPGTPQIINILMNTPSYSQITFDKVEFHPETDSKITVNFSVENAYDKEEMDQSVAFVVIENDVTPKGDDENALKEWNQSNAYSGVTKEAIVKAYGEDLWPYFEFYCNESNPVRYSKMKYQHVARGIFPNYDGLPLTGSCKAEEKVSYKASFHCPGNVDDNKNISIVALLIDRKTDRILTAAEMPSAWFNGNDPGSGVMETADNGITVIYTDGMLSVKAPEAMTVEVIGIDGITRARYSAPDGQLCVPASEFNGVNVVRVTTPDGVCVKKFAF